MGIESLVRENVKLMQAYSSARDEFKQQADVYLDANENPYDDGLNRYPDPYQKALKEKLSKIKGIAPSNMLLGNGSDEVLDLIFRVFCEPKNDNIIIVPPTYGMYKVLAAVNDVAVKEVVLTEEFSLDIEGIKATADEKTKLVFICSPNNPTGNLMGKKAVEELLQDLNCIVVIDEAYIDFCKEESWADRLNEFPNLIVCQTLSKAWGLAGIRLGMCFASEYIIGVLNKIKPPYNVNQLTQSKALEVLKSSEIYEEELLEILKEKEVLKVALEKFSFVEKIYESDANFWLVKVADANGLYQYLAGKGVVVRNRTKEYGCKNCLRITVGTSSQNEVLIKVLKDF